MKDPAFLFYSNDFLSGTMLMSNEEIGIYIKLLCLQHQQGHLKEEDMLSIGATKKIFSKFIKDEEGNYYNERLEHEANKRKAYSESRKNNRKKKETYEKDMLNICNSYEEHMENENINININNNNIKNNSKKDSKGKKEEEKIHFADFVTMTNVEHEKLVSTYGTEFTDQCIKILDNYKGSKGKEYKSDYRAILSWVVDEAKKRKQESKYNSNKTAYNDYSQRSYENLDGLYANMKEVK